MIIPSTIREDIDQNSDQELSHRTFNGCAYLHYVKNGETIKIPLNHIINKYKEYFDPYIEKFDITEEDERKYLYSPKKLSLDVYKTTEYTEQFELNDNSDPQLTVSGGTISLYESGIAKITIDKILLLPEDKYFTNILHRSCNKKELDIVNYFVIKNSLGDPIIMTRLLGSNDNESFKKVLTEVDPQAGLLFSLSYNANK